MPLFETTVGRVEKWTKQGDVKNLLKALKSDNGAVQQAAAEGLGKLGGNEVLDHCRSMANNPDQRQRWLVSLILGAIATPPAMEILASVEDPSDKMTRLIAKKTMDPRSKKPEV
jgi:HEAT repeat protein